MKINDVYFIIKYIIITGIVGLCPGILNSSDGLQAQDSFDKRTLLYEYNNMRKEAATGGSMRVTMSLSRPYRIEIEGDKIFNISGNDTIGYEIQDVSLENNYRGCVEGENWVDYFTVNADSVVYTMSSSFEMEMNEDTVLFKKNGRIAVISYNPQVYNSDSSKINITKIYKNGSNIVYKYDRPDKSKPVVFDPVWHWQPFGMSEDSWVDEGNPETNYGDSYYLYLGYKDDAEWRSFIKFPGLIDSLYALGEVSIDSVKILIKRVDEPWGSNQFYVKRPVSNWSEAAITWNNQPVCSTPFSDDTVSMGIYNYFNVTALTKAYYENMYPYYGYCFTAITLSGDNGTGYGSSDNPSANKPEIYVWYSPLEDIGLSVSALSETSIVCTVDTSKNGYMDSFVVMRSSDSSAIGDVFYTLSDTIDTLGINTAYSLIAGGYSNDSLTYFSFPDSIYTLAAVPENPFVQTWSVSSIRIQPLAGDNPLSTKLALYDSTLHTYISSAGDTVSSPVWQTQADWDSVIIGGRDPNTNYQFGAYAKNEYDSITCISELSECKTNSTIDSFEVNAFSDSSYVICFGKDTVRSPFMGYVAIDDSDSSIISDTIESCSFGIKTLITKPSYPLNTMHSFRIVRIENPCDSLYYSVSDSAYTFTATPSPPVISGMSDSTFLLIFNDISGNPDSIKYSVFDSTYMAYRDTAGDTSSSVVLAVDSVWNNSTMKTYEPNLFISVGIAGLNNDSVYGGISSDTTWTFASVPGITNASVIDSARILLQLDPNGNPSYTYFAVEDSISGKFIDIFQGTLRFPGVTEDSSWAFGTYSNWGANGGYIVKVEPGTHYYFRTYAKDGNSNP
nr:hypothetical protein 5 [bacterium]